MNKADYEAEHAEIYERKRGLPSFNDERITAVFGIGTEYEAVVVYRYTVFKDWSGRIMFKSYEHDHTLEYEDYRLPIRESALNIILDAEEQWKRLVSQLKAKRGEP